VFINDLPKFINDKSVPILFPDDTSLLVSHSNPLVSYKTINDVFQILNAWFKILSQYYVPLITEYKEWVKVKHNYIVVFDFYPLFILCINTQRGCHTLKYR